MPNLYLYIIKLGQTYVKYITKNFIILQFICIYIFPQSNAICLIKLHLPSPNSFGLKIKLLFYWEWPRRNCRTAAQSALVRKTWQPWRHKVHVCHFNNLNGPLTNQVSLTHRNAVLLTDNFLCISFHIAF